MTGNAYRWINEFISTRIERVVEVGSRDALDALSLANHFGASVVAFECDPRQFDVCCANLSLAGTSGVQMRQEALSDVNDEIEFWQVDLTAYDNPGVGSMFKINFDNRTMDDADWHHEPVQRPISVAARRFDHLGISAPDLLVMDVEGAELRVLRGFGDLIDAIRYIVLETAPVSNHIGGSSFREVREYLESRGFRYVASSCSGKGLLRLRLDLLRRTAQCMVRGRTLKPSTKWQGFFDVLFSNRSLN